MKRNVYCKHITKKIEKSIYIYKLIDFDLNICDKCEKKLRKLILAQIKIEKSI